ncbi:MAG: ribonuclease III [Thermodesulfobacteriota bacterium]|nr:ribonuclease III [Thermodesulfobacteriota bacterium]
MNELHISQFETLQKKMGYLFSNKELLVKALTHSSFHKDSESVNENNERMEFLGDAVLELVISHLLLKIHSTMNEGSLSRVRASIVNEKQLADMAKSLDLGDHILLGKGEKLSCGKEKSSILANAYEAILAAIYLDGGYDKAFEFIKEQFREILKNVDERTKYKDYKTVLQERTQNVLKCKPKYVLMQEFGPPHEKTFEMGVTIDGKFFGIGVGKSKKKAEQEAAKMALQILSNPVIY